MGRVFIARDASGRTVALKVVHQFLAEDAEFRARFAREVAALGAVRGRYTAALVEADTEAEAPWLATAYLTGPTLSARVRDQGPLSLAELTRLAHALAGALDAVHAAGLVHRDLKPSNVVLTEGGPRVVDFGIARALDGTRLTATGFSPGSVGYAAPEQLTRDISTPAADVFSLGAVLTFAATGRAPFGRGTASAVNYRTVHGEPDLAGLPPGPLLALVRRCLAKSPEGRPRPGEVIAATAAVQAGPTPSRPPQPPPASPPSPSPVEGVPPGAGRALLLGRGGRGRRSGRIRRPWWAWAAGVAVLTALAVLATVLVLVPQWLDDDSKKEAVGGGGPAGQGSPHPTPSASREPAPSPTPSPTSIPTALPLSKPVGNGKVPTGPGADVPAPPDPPGIRKQVWKANVPGSREDRTLIGGWLYGDLAVRFDRMGARGYDIASGRMRWTLPAPTGLRTCAVSTGPSATSGGIGAALFGTDQNHPYRCPRVGAVDVRTGRLLWTKDIGWSTAFSISALGVTGKVLVVAGERGLLGLDRATGKEVWHYAQGIEGCTLSTVLTGPRTVAMLQKCRGYATGPVHHPNTVRELDVASGRERWHHTLPETDPDLLTTEPVTVSLGRGGDGSADSLLVYDTTGLRPHELPLEGPYGKISSRRGEQRASALTTDERNGLLITQSGGRLAVVETATGKVRFHRRLPSYPIGMTLLSATAGHVTMVASILDAYEPSPTMRLSLKDGSVSSEGLLPATPELGGIGDIVRATGRWTVVFTESPRTPIGMVVYG